MNTPSYAMSGDLGDIIFSLRTCHQIQTPGHYYLVDRPFTKAWNPSRVNALKPLLESQPYISGVSHEEPKEKPTHDFTDFRSVGLTMLKNLADHHAEFVGVTLKPYTPWLTVEPDPSTEGVVLIHRSPRYHNPLFPLREIGAKFENLVAVGVPDEHEALERDMDRKLELIQTTDYLQLAKLIAGCKLFIGNQSSPMSIALGVGAPVLQETCIWQPDCIYPGANAYFSVDGYAVVGDITLGVKNEFLLNPNELPPKGWIFKGKQSNSFHSLCRSVDPNRQMNRDDLTHMILVENTERVRRDFPTHKVNTSNKLTHRATQTQEFLAKNHHQVVKVRQ